MDLNQPDYYNALKFLQSLAELAAGYVEKSFTFGEIWSRAKIVAVDENYFKQNILPKLIGEKLIEVVDYNQIRINDSGIYDVSEFWKIPSTTLGILSKDDLNKYSRMLIEYLYDKVKHEEGKFSMSKIHKDRFGGLGPTAMMQIGRYLTGKGLIKMIDKDQFTLGFSGVRKTIGAPRKKAI